MFSRSGAGSLIKTAARQDAFIQMVSHSLWKKHGLAQDARESCAMVLPDAYLWVGLFTLYSSLALLVAEDMAA